MPKIQRRVGFGNEYMKHNNSVKLILIVLFSCCVWNILAQDSISSDSIYQITDTPPSFPGGDGKMFKFIAENIMYPEEAIKSGIQGKVYCEFIVEIDGSLSQIKVVRSPSSDYLNEEAIRVIKMMPAWEPGKIKDIPVRTKYVIPVKFNLGETVSVDNTVYAVKDVDAMPEFPGGQEALLAYFDETAISPCSNEIPRVIELKKYENKEFTVLLTFVVDKEGRLHEVTLQKSCGDLTIDSYCVQAARNMPRWNPGYKDGHPVNVTYYLPVKFHYKPAESLSVLQQYMDRHFDFPPIKSGQNDIISLDVYIPISFSIDTLGMIYDIELCWEIKYIPQYITGNIRYDAIFKEKARAEFNDNDLIATRIENYKKNLEESFKEFIQTINDAQLQVTKENVTEMSANKQSVILYRDGTKRYVITRKK